MKVAAGLLVGLTVIVAGCSDRSQTESPKTEASTKALVAQPERFEQGHVVTAKDFAGDGVTLKIHPNPFRSCDFPKGGAVVTIEYDARPAGIKHTQAWFEQANGKQVLWGQAPAYMPPNQTGNWVHEGMKLLLVDVDTRQLIAVRTVHAAACQ